MVTRKATILETATSLFKQQGKDNTSVREIAKQAGVSHSLLHKHWDSKDTLYLECVASEVGKLRQLISAESSRVENTLYFLLKHPDQWTLIARCLSLPPATDGEGRRLKAKVEQRIRPLLDDLMKLTTGFTGQTSIDNGQSTDLQAAKAWFFVIVSVFSGHCLLRRSLETYLGESDLHVARRVTIDAFYENWIFKGNNSSQQA